MMALVVVEAFGMETFVAAVVVSEMEAFAVVVAVAVVATVVVFGMEEVVVEAVAFLEAVVAVAHHYGRSLVL